MAMDIVQLQHWCESLPSVITDIKWENNLCFTVGGKIFCMIALDEAFSVSFKAADDDFHELLERDGIIPAPYLARAKWVSVIRENALTLREWEQYLFQAYKLVTAKLSRKVRQQLGLNG